MQFIQFIPAVERTHDGGVTDWTVRAGQWGQFLCAVFDEWVRHDVGRVFEGGPYVQPFLSFSAHSRKFTRRSVLRKSMLAC